MTNDADVRRMSGTSASFTGTPFLEPCDTCPGNGLHQDSRLLRHVSAQPAAIIETASTPTGTIEAPVAAMDWFLSLPAFLSSSLSVFGFWPSPESSYPARRPDPDSGWDPGQDQASASGQDRDQDQASDPGRDRLSPSP